MLLSVGSSIFAPGGAASCSGAVWPQAPTRGEPRPSSLDPAPSWWTIVPHTPAAGSELTWRGWRRLTETARPPDAPAALAAGLWCCLFRVEGPDDCFECPHLVSEPSCEAHWGLLPSIGHEVSVVLPDRRRCVPLCNGCLGQEHCTMILRIKVAC